VAELEAISCTSAQTCVAVGQYTGTHGTTQGLIETLANGTWTPSEAPLPQAAPARQKAILWALACTAPGSCSAVGQYTGTHGTTQGLIETLASGKWIPAQAPLPAGASDQKTAELYGLACAGSNPCAAVGQYTDAHGTAQGLIETRTSQSWIPGQAALPHNAARTSQNAALYTVACSVTGTCLAAGSYADDHKHIQGLIETTTPVNIAVAAVAPPASNAAPPTSQPSTSPPSPSPSNSLAASFSDGTQVLVTGGAQDGGTGNGWTENLEIIAGPDGLPNVGSLLVQAADSNAWASNGHPLFYHGYATPGSGVTNEPPLPSNATNQDVPPPAELAPGTSICVSQDFQNANSSSANSYGPGQYSVTATLANGARETVSLPTDGSGPGDACLFD
jgi:hypothetical protein